MKILACNVGSTSLKFKLYDMPGERVLAQGRVERVGSADSAIYHFKNPATGYTRRLEGQSVPGYTEGIRLFLADLLAPQQAILAELPELGAVGFKTVLAKDHYGVHRIDEAVIRGMEAYLNVAPAHNGPYLEAIRQFQKLLPQTPLVGVFETAFHTTIPQGRRMYAIPYDWYEQYGIQRMGYHGASHGYVARRVAALMGEGRRVISCHLGGSCSLCAIENGQSVDNSFGFSLQTGIPHSGRVGDVDPYIVPFLLDEGLTMEEILAGMGKRAGMLGLSGLSGDMRDIEEAAEAGNARAQLALEVFVTAIVRTIGAYYAELGGLDALVFTGGIGENSLITRRAVCGRLGHMGVRLDEAANAAGPEERTLSPEGAPVRVMVIPADEEIMIAQKTFETLEAG